MSETKRAELMREFVESFAAQDIEKSVSLCTEDVVWETPMGIFKGKEEVKRYMKWNAERNKEVKIAEAGVGILVQGDKASFEHQITGLIDGEKVSFLAMCTYEFSEDQIKTMRTVFDRLALAEQASNKWLPKKLVNTIVSQMHKGLD